MGFKKLTNVNDTFIEHLTLKGETWILEMCNSYFRNPKDAHTKWFIRFTAKLRNIGKEEILKALKEGKNFYHYVDISAPTKLTYKLILPKKLLKLRDELRPYP